MQLPKLFNWVKIVKEIVEKDPKETPKVIYEKLLSMVSDEDKCLLPNAKKVKEKISQLKQACRRKLMQSIV